MLAVSNSINIVEFLIEKNLSIAVSESVTGGLLSKTITDFGGSSKIFLGGIVSYSVFSKIHILKVPQELIEKFGTVHPEIAKNMAINTQLLFNSDIAISTTGIAGPDAIEGKPVGLAYVGFAFKDGKNYVFEVNFTGNRDIIRNRIVNFTLNQLYKLLVGGY